MAISESTVADIPEMAALINSAYRGESAKLGWTWESDLLRGIRTDEEELYGYLTRSDMTMLKCVGEEGRIIGCVYLEMKPSHQSVYAGMLTVSPLLQGRGIGKVLLEAVDDFARKQGCRAVELSVISVRRELIEWYERRGFRPTGEKIPLETDKSVSEVPLELMFMKKNL